MMRFFTKSKRRSLGFITASLCCAALNGQALATPDIDFPETYCPALSDQLWVQSEQRRTFESDFSDILDTLKYCERRAITDEEIISLAVDALLLVTLARNDVVASHTVIPAPTAENKKAGDEIESFAQYLVRNINPETINTDGSYYARAVFNGSAISILNNEDLALAMPQTGYRNLKQLFGADDAERRRRRFLGGFGPSLWPNNVESKND